MAVSGTRTSRLVASATGLGSLTLLPVAQFVVEALGGLGEALMEALLALVLALAVLALVEALAEALPEALLALLVGAVLEAMLFLMEALTLLAWARAEALLEALLLLAEALAQLRSLQTLLLQTLLAKLRSLQTVLLQPVLLQPVLLQTLLLQTLLQMKSEAAHRGCSSPSRAAAHRLPPSLGSCFLAQLLVQFVERLPSLGSLRRTKETWMVLGPPAGRSCRNLRAPGKGG